VVDEATTLELAQANGIEDLIVVAQRLTTAQLVELSLSAAEQGLASLAVMWLAILASRAAGEAAAAGVFPSLFKSLMDRNAVESLSQFATLIVSGATGRRSFGSMPKRLIRDWLNDHSPAELYRLHARVKHSRTTLGDLVRLTHPRPPGRKHAVMYRWLVGGDVNENELPEEARKAS
jgi:60 kDa SS-A/Ro ribonucleoprotein